MRLMTVMCLAAVAAAPMIALAARAADDGPYHVLQVAKVGGDGGYYYVKADSADRRLFVIRRGKPAEVDVYDLDTLKQVGSVPAGGVGAVGDPKSGHGFTSGDPVTMFDVKTLKVIKTIPVPSSREDLTVDDYTDRVFFWSHNMPYGLAVDAVTGNIVGNIDVGGGVEAGVSDGAGHVYAVAYDKTYIAVIDAKTLQVTAHYPILGPNPGKDDECGALAIDRKNHILFAACKNAKSMTILSADTGKIITTLPLPDISTDGEGFNPATMENFSSHGSYGGLLTVIKENSPTNFVVEQNLKTIDDGKSMALDTNTGHVFIVGAEYEPPAANAKINKGREPRGPMVPGSFSIVEVGK